MPESYKIDETGQILVPMQATAYANFRRLISVANDDKSMTDQSRRTKFIHASISNLLMFPLEDVADAFFKANTKYSDALQNFENCVWKNVDPSLDKLDIMEIIPRVLFRDEYSRYNSSTMVKWEDPYLMLLREKLKDRREISCVSLVLSGANAKPGKEHIWYEIHEAFINPKILPVPGMYPAPQREYKPKCKPRYGYSTYQVQMFYFKIFGWDSPKHTFKTPQKSKTASSDAIQPRAPKKRRMADMQPAPLFEPVEAVLLPVFESVAVMGGSDNAAPVVPEASPSPLLKPLPVDYSPLLKPLPVAFSPLLKPTGPAQDVVPSRAASPCPVPPLGSRAASPCVVFSNPFAVSHPGTRTNSRASSPALFHHLKAFPSRGASPMDLFAHISWALAHEHRPPLFQSRGLWSRDSSPAPEALPPSFWPSRSQTREPTPVSL